MKTSHENDVDRCDEEEDDDVFEVDVDGSDNYLNFPHDEEQGRQDGLNDSYSSIHYSSLDEESASIADESQGASGWIHEDMLKWVCASDIYEIWYFLKKPLC